ncbi:MAG: hypothetical protein KJO40_13415 [Deltaproteobacteria bacterium]|nr:hypothetical protein [Deltaproteobacteria bacterium]
MYIPQGFTPEQEKALFDIDPDALRELPPEIRAEMVLRHREVEAQQKSVFWDSMQAFATLAIPVAAALGLWKFLGIKK